MGITSTVGRIKTAVMGSRTVKEDPDSQPTTEDRDRATLDLVGSLKQESWDFITAALSGEMSLRNEWEDNANRFVGNYQTGEGEGSYATSQSENYRIINGKAISSRVGLKRAFLMRTQNSVMSNTATATATPIRGRLEPVEFGEEGVWYLTPRGGRIVSGAIKSQIDTQSDEISQVLDEVRALEVSDPDSGGGLEAEAQEHELAQKLGTVQEEVEGAFGNLSVDQLDGEYGPSQPIDEDQYDALMEMVAAGLMPLRDTDIISVTDKFVSQRAQQVCDVLTDRANMPMYWMMFALDTNISGHGCGEFEWHTTGRFRNGFTFDISHPMNVFTDPCHWDMKFRNYHIENNVVPLDKLTTKWPDFIQQLKAVAREGKRSSDDGSVLGGLSENVVFQRQMVTVTTSWIRDQIVPLSAEDAVAEGLVVAEPAFEDTESKTPAYDEKTGEPLMRYFLPSSDVDEDGEPVNGEEVYPQDEVKHGTSWPDGPGLRQIVTVQDGNLVMQDIRCPYPDIPRVWGINIPRGDKSPYGQGEPVRLKHIDEIINYTLSMLVNYLGSLGFPTCIWPKTLMARMAKAGISINTRPNMHIPIDDDKWMMMMKAGGFDSVRFHQTPLPASYANFLEQMLKEHDTMSGNVDVRQGRLPSANASGKLISELRQGAESSLSIKSRFLETTVTDFYRILIHAVTHWLPESEWAKILNRYELPVVREVIRRVRETQWNVTVKISSGRGADDDFEQDRALSMYDRRLIGGEDALEKLKDDDPAGTARKASEYWNPGAAAQEQGGAEPQQGQPDPSLN